MSLFASNHSCNFEMVSRLRRYCLSWQASPLCARIGAATPLIQLHTQVALIWISIRFCLHHRVGTAVRISFVERIRQSSRERLPSRNCYEGWNRRRRKQVRNEGEIRRDEEGSNVAIVMSLVSLFLLSLLSPMPLLDYASPSAVHLALPSSILQHRRPLAVEFLIRAARVTPTSTLSCSVDRDGYHGMPASGSCEFGKSRVAIKSRRKFANVGDTAGWLAGWLSV